MFRHRDDVQIAGLPVALRAKGETSAEIAGMASAMLTHAKRVRLTERAVDIVVPAVTRPAR